MGRKRKGRKGRRGRGRGEVIDAGQSVYEYLDANQWRELKPEEIRDRFVIEETFLLIRP